MIAISICYNLDERLCKVSSVSILINIRGNFT
ncbi:unnamed protein product [Spirodela intermedia]|uniref:Uncharacterized protein n=1 Tax=Spirodela intermedia TaxID=51605 RepID=A0A7I8LCX9_SPIIN|nr:unnamed protein product [Spirodela intermedia]